MTSLRFAIVAAATVLTASFTGGVLNAAADEYRGRACIIQVNAACEPLGYEVGYCTNMRLSPPNALGNGNNTRLSLFHGFYAQNFAQEGSAIGGTYQDAMFSAIGRGGGTAVESQTKWRIPLVQPVNFNQPWLHMVVDIFRFDDYGSGDGSLCLTRWRVAGMPVPDPAAAPATEGGDLGAMDELLSSSGLGNAAPALND